jgi:(2Fe-2S) ferredoxin
MPMARGKPIDYIGAMTCAGGPRGASAIIGRERPRRHRTLAPSRSDPAMSYYKRHVFFCCNERAAPEACCANHGSVELQAYAKARVKELGESGKGRVRVNKAGCLDRCEEGPCLVVYPEAVWYTYVDRADIDEIIDRHVIRGEIVERLRI